MKKTPLKFGPVYAGKIQSRRLGLLNFRNVAYKEDGPDDDDIGEDDPNDPPEKQLLNKIEKRIAKEIEKRDLQGSDEVKKLILKQLEGLDLEALREFNTKSVEASVKKIAGALEKLQNRTAEKLEKLDLRSALTTAMPKIETLFKRRGAGQEVVLNVRAAAVMTTDNTIDEGLDLPQDLIESFSMAEFVPKRYGNQFIAEIADRTTVQEVEQYRTWLEEGSEEGAFAIVAEGGVKPLVSMSLVRNFSEAKKIAGKYIITEEFAKFRKQAYTIIRQLIQDKMYRDYHALLLAALTAQAAGYVGTTLDGTIISPNDYDAIGAVCAQIESLNFMPDVLILNPQDKWRLRLSKDNEGRYLFPVVTENGVERVFALRLITSTYQPVGTFKVGESGLFKIEEEPITIRIGYGVDAVVEGGNVTAVNSDFDKNQLRVILETFFHAYIATNNLGSYVNASFTTVKTALAAA